MKHDLSALSDEDLERASENLALAAQDFPSLFLSLNIAQYRALEAIYTIGDNGHFADMVSVEFANGVGKTSLLAIDLIGWTMGPEYLNEALFPPCAIDFWRSLSKKRDRGALTMRLVCSAIDMKEQGSVLEILKKFFPWAKMSKQDNTGCFKQIDIPHPTIVGIVNHVAVLTFDQEPQKHAGPTLDRIFVNENLPEGLWTETSARCRGGGNIVQFATILEHSTHLNELEDGTNFILKRCKGHIFENCIGSEVTDQMAAEVYDEIRVVLDRERGGGYKTNGVLHRHDIEKMIESWMKTNPDEVQARKTGRPISEGGKIFPLYSDEVHMVRDGTFDNIPDDWPMGMAVDPHPARPDAVIWFVILSSDRLAIVDEWPGYSEFGHYDKIKDCRYTVPQKCSIWRELEASRGYSDRIYNNRIGDPNRFLEPDENTMGNLRDLYIKQGFTFQIGINDDFEYGRELVNQYLWYDAAVRAHAPSDPAGKPRLVIYERCVNTRRALANFARKISRDRSKPISEEVDKRFECFCALVRYLVVWHQNHHFADVRHDPDRLSDYEYFKRGRIPKGMRKPIGPKLFDNKGRRVLS